MNQDSTVKTTEDDNGEHKFNRKEVIHLGFQNKTRGEAAFNAISYIGDGYFVVTALSVFATWLMNDKLPGMGKSIRAAAEKIRLPASIGTIATLFIGGTIASVFPVKLLEDHKPTGVKKLDYLLYSEDQFYNDPKIQAAHKELDELPKQTWWSVLGSRVVAFGATFAVFLAMGGNKSPLAKATGHSLDELSIKAGRGIDRWMNKNNLQALGEIEHAFKLNEAIIPQAFGKKLLPVHEVMRDANGVKGDRIPSRVYSYIVLDAFYTAITSVSLWVSTRVFGAMVGQDAKVAAAKAEIRHHKKLHSPIAAEAVKHPVSSDEAPEQPAVPDAKITSPIRIERVAEPQRTAELSA